MLNLICKSLCNELSLFLLINVRLHLQYHAVDALRIIKGSLIDINGNLSNWNRGDPCTSNWTGVMCSNTTLVDGYLHVLQLYDFNLLLKVSFLVKAMLRCISIHFVGPFSFIFCGILATLSL